MQKNDVEHDPANRQQPGEAAIHRSLSGHFGGHAISKDGNGKSRNQAHCGRYMGLVAIDFLDASLPLEKLLLKLYWRLLPVIAVAALRVVEHFDVIEDILPCRFACWIGLAFDSFAL